MRTERREPTKGKSPWLEKCMAESADVKWAIFMVNSFV